MLGEMTTRRFDGQPSGKCGVVSREEAQAPFVALERVAWSAAATYPPFLRTGNHHTFMLY